MCYLLCRHESTKIKLFWERDIFRCETNKQNNSGEKKCGRVIREKGLRPLLSREFTYLSSARSSFTVVVYGSAGIFIRSISSKLSNFSLCYYPGDKS